MEEGKDTSGGEYCRWRSTYQFHLSTNCDSYSTASTDPAPCEMVVINDEPPNIQTAVKSGFGSEIDQFIPRMREESLSSQLSSPTAQNPATETTSPRTVKPDSLGSPRISASSAPSRFDRSSANLPALEDDKDQRKKIAQPSKDDTGKNTSAHDKDADDGNPQRRKDDRCFPSQFTIKQRLSRCAVLCESFEQQPMRLQRRSRLA